MNLFTKKTVINALHTFRHFKLHLQVILKTLKLRILNKIMFKTLLIFRVTLKHLNFLNFYKVFETNLFLWCTMPRSWENRGNGETSTLGEHHLE